VLCVCVSVVRFDLVCFLSISRKTRVFILLRPEGVRRVYIYDSRTRDPVVVGRAGRSWRARKRKKLFVHRNFIIVVIIIIVCVVCIRTTIYRYTVNIVKCGL